MKLSENALFKNLAWKQSEQANMLISYLEQIQQFMGSTQPLDHTLPAFS